MKNLHLYLLHTQADINTHAHTHTILIGIREMDEESLLSREHFMRKEQTRREESKTAKTE